MSTSVRAESGLSIVRVEQLPPQQQILCAYHTHTHTWQGPTHLHIAKIYTTYHKHTVHIGMCIPIQAVLQRYDHIRQTSSALRQLCLHIDPIPSIPTNHKLVDGHNLEQTLF